MNQYSRTEMLIGKDKLKKLRESHVALFGLGGVGGYTLEALVRSGVGKLTVVDDDVVCLTNLNRQILATRQSIGKKKTDLAVERAASIDPDIEIVPRDVFFTAENADEFDFANYDYIIDAIDTVSAKIALVMAAHDFSRPIICSMGAANKLDASGFRVSDIYDTKVDPLAKVMRRELRARNVEHLKVVYSLETPIQPTQSEDNGCKYSCVCPPDSRKSCLTKRQVPGSTAFVPAAAGLLLAGEAIRDLISPERMA